MGARAGEEPAAAEQNDFTLLSKPLQGLHQAWVAALQLAAFQPLQGPLFPGALHLDEAGLPPLPGERGKQVPWDNLQQGEASGGKCIPDTDTSRPGCRQTVKGAACMGWILKASLSSENTDDALLSSSVSMRCM